MFNELPGFFDRNFIIAYFFPALIFVLAGFALLNNFDLDPRLKENISDDLYKGATIIGVISLVIAVFLLALNYRIIKFFEGYGKFNPLNLLEPVYLHKFHLIEEKKFRLKGDQTKAEDIGNEELSKIIQKQRNEIHSYAADHYPLRYSRVLPTAFGNSFRAFEDYSEEMYGADAIVTWVRLLAVIPKDFREMMNSARVQVDMWVNFRFLGCLLFVIYFYMIISTGQFKITWFAMLILGFIYLASKRSVEAVILWGDFVKSSYDLYLPDLRDQVRLNETKTVKEEIALWNKFTKQILYHDRKSVLMRTEAKKSSKDD